MLDPAPLSPDRALALLLAGPAWLSATDASGAPGLWRVHPERRGSGLHLGGAPALEGRPALLVAEDALGEGLGERAELRGVVREGALPLAQLSGESRLGQALAPDERARLLQSLWGRGGPRAAEAVERVRSATPAAAPPWLRGPGGTTLHPWATASDRAQALELLREVYWNVGVPEARLVAALENSTCAVVARDASGAVVAHARAMSENAKYAWIYDVIVAPSWRGRGLGQAVVQLLLEHPAVRQAAMVLLKTRDAHALYAKFGFIDPAQLPPRPYTSSEMVLKRGLTPNPSPVGEGSDLQDRRSLPSPTGEGPGERLTGTSAPRTSAAR